MMYICLITMEKQLDDIFYSDEFVMGGFNRLLKEVKNK